MPDKLSTVTKNSLSEYLPDIIWDFDKSFVNKLAHKQGIYFCYGSYKDCSIRLKLVRYRCSQKYFITFFDRDSTTVSVSNYKQLHNVFNSFKEMKLFNSPFKEKLDCVLDWHYASRIAFFLDGTSRLYYTKQHEELKDRFYIYDIVNLDQLQTYNLKFWLKYTSRKTSSRNVSPDDKEKIKIAGSTLLSLVWKDLTKRLQSIVVDCNMYNEVLCIFDDKTIDRYSFRQQKDSNEKLLINELKAHAINLVYKKENIDNFSLKNRKLEYKVSRGIHPAQFTLPSPTIPGSGLIRPGVHVTTVNLNNYSIP